MCSKQFGKGKTGRGKAVQKAARNVAAATTTGGKFILN